MTSSGSRAKLVGAWAQKKEQRQMPVLAVTTGAGVLFGAIYVVLLITLGILAIRKGHWVMFIIGIFIPLFWIIGAMLPPTRSD